MPSSALFSLIAVIALIVFLFVYRFERRKAAQAASAVQLSYERAVIVGTRDIVHTNVSAQSYGGGGYVHPGGGGYVAAPTVSVSSTTTEWHHFFVQFSDGREIELHADAREGFAARSGHPVDVYLANTKSGALVARIVNLATGRALIWNANLKKAGLECWPAAAKIISALACLAVALVPLPFIPFIAQRKTVTEVVAVGVIAALFVLGIILLTRSKKVAVQLTLILLGNVSTHAEPNDQFFSASVKTRSLPQGLLGYIRALLMLAPGLLLAFFGVLVPLKLLLQNIGGEAWFLSVWAQKPGLRLIDNNTATFFGVYAFVIVALAAVPAVRRQSWWKIILLGSLVGMVSLILIA